MGFQPIIAKPVDKRTFINSIKSNAVKIGEPSKKDFEKTTQTWDGKPTFEITVTEQGGRTAFLEREIELFVGVISNWRPGRKATPKDIWRFVTRGTSKRHALMSANFSPKTRKGFIGSSSGRGGVVRVSKNITRPGIESRDFEETVSKKNKKQIQKDWQKTLDEAAKVSRWTF